MSQERSYGLGTDVRADRHRIEVQHIEHCLCIRLTSVRDIAALGIRQHKGIGRNFTYVLHRGIQGTHPGDSQCLVEGELQLVRNHKVVSRIHDFTIELWDISNRHPRWVRIKSNADVAPRRFDCANELGAHGGVIPSLQCLLPHL